MQDNYDGIPLTPEQSRDIDRYVDEGMNYPQAAARVLGKNAIRRSVSRQPAKRTKTAYPEGGAYRGRHPIPPTQRQRTIGDAGIGKADTLYGPKK